MLRHTFIWFVPIQLKKDCSDYKLVFKWDMTPRSSRSMAVTDLNLPRQGLRQLHREGHRTAGPARG